ncbi:MAG: thioredoxin [Candidatus Kapabacteria bacterium]|nr:thioredoxin [Candidatus Kapabacteria bacterium]
MKSVITSLLILILATVVACDSQTATSLAPEAFAKTLKETKNAVVLDVRTPDEFQRGFLQGAMNIDYNSDGFEAGVSALDKSKPYFVYCLSGGRSSSAASYMRKNGFTNVYELKGGVLAWQKSKLPLTTTQSAPPASSGMSINDYKQLMQSPTPVLVDFYAPWCGPCKKMEPMLKELERERPSSLRIVRINVDENKDLAQYLGIEAIPVLKMFRNGAELWSHSGYADKAMILGALKGR